MLGESATRAARSAPSACSTTSTGCSDAAGVTPAELEPDRRRHRAGHVHRPAHRPRDRPRARVRARRPGARASRRSTRCASGDERRRGLHGRPPRRGVRRRRRGSMPQAIAPASARGLPSPPATVCAGDGAVRYRDSLDGRSRSRPTTRRCTSRGPAITPRCAPRRPAGAALSARARRRPRTRREGRRMMTAVELRRCETSDLDAIEELERARYRRRGRARCSPASSPSRAASAWGRSRARTCSDT